MNIALLGKFKNLHDEEYIARSFEMLGHNVARIPSTTALEDIPLKGITVVIYFKLNNPGNVKEFLAKLRDKKIISVAWLFDLYFDYPREHRLFSPSIRCADWVFSTDGGHNDQFVHSGINHRLLRQGIYAPECYIEEGNRHGIVFVGSENPLYRSRTETIEDINREFQDVRWIGRYDTNECRGTALNTLFGSSKIVIGDSVYSPHYWSNRVVETLGRGGFLIHQYVPGIREEYPYLVTYERGNRQDLKDKIRYYLKHEDEREKIRQDNFKWVKENYTMDKKCKQLIDILEKHYA